tara:strand:+ start:1281 stop:1670 length:390 start_codon:yes stop_codon:yes gene_type:complete
VSRKKRIPLLLRIFNGKRKDGREKLENLTLRCDNLKRLLRIYIIIRDYVIVSKHSPPEPMINLDQKYESYVRNGEKKLRIDGIQERVRGYGYTDDGKDIDGYYLITDNYTLFYNRDEQFLRMEALVGVG